MSPVPSLDCLRDFLYKELVETLRVREPHANDLSNSPEVYLPHHEEMISHIAVDVRRSFRSHHESR